MSASLKEKLLQRAFQIFVFLLPTQLSIHFWPEWALVFGIRSDYLAPAIYLSDLILLLALFLWLIRKPKLPILNTKTAVIFLLVMVFIVINVSIAVNWEVAIVKWLKVFELSALIFFVAVVKKLNFKNWIGKPLSLAIIFISSLAIGQFLFQKTLGGFFYFFGERSFNVQTPGVALVNIFGNVLMRAYSTFSHPNSMAGFILVALLLVSGNKERQSKKLVLLFAAIGLILSFSLGAWLAAAVVVVLLLMDRKYFSFLFKIFFWLLLFTSLLLPVISQSGIGQELVSQNKRLELAIVAGSLFSQSPIFGIGLNNFITGQTGVISTPSTIWWLQPVHNIFLLLLTETGIVGLLLFVYIFSFSIYKLLTEIKNYKHIALGLLVIVITGSVDHYWLTLQQNMFLASLVLGLSFRKTLN